MEQINKKSAIEEIVRKIFEANPKFIEDYRPGKDKAMRFLAG